MIIANMMTKNPVTVTPDVSANDAAALMAKEKVNKLPVIDKNDKLVGIITKKDLIKAGPSAATTLDMYEVSYLLSKLKVEKIMTKNVLSVQDTEVVEEAARIMADNDIGCLPVLKGHLLVGIITESDLFREFIEMFGARHKGVRVIFSLDEKPGQLAILCTAIADAGGNIVALVTGDGDDMTKRRISCKISKLSLIQVKEIFSKLKIDLEDTRE